MNVCAKCHVPWPCLKVEHNLIWSLKIWRSDDSRVSIACHVLDHEECREPTFCLCSCHGIEWLSDPAISVPPSNR